MTRLKTRNLLVGFVLLTLLLASVVLYAHFLLQKPSVQKTLVERLGQLTGYHVRTGAIELSLWGSIGFIVHSFDATSKESEERIQAESLLVTLNTAELVQGRIAPLSLGLIRPTIEFRLPEHGALHYERPSLAPLPWFPGLKSLSVEGGTLIIHNHPYTVHALNLDIRTNGIDPLGLTVASSGMVLYGEHKIPFRTYGTLMPLLDGPETGPYELRATVEDIPLSWVPWPDKLSFDNGKASAEFSMEGAWNEPIATEGQVTFSDVRFMLGNQAQTKSYAPPEVSLRFQGLVDNAGVRFPEVTLQSEELLLALALEVDMPAEDPPRVRMRLESKDMSFALMERYFPTPLLPSWVENRLFPLLRTGEVRLDHLTIKGSLDEIKHLNKPENAGALSLAVACWDFLIEGDAVPDSFAHVAGRVTYHDGDLLITDLKGSLDDSIIREGRLEIRDLMEDHSVWDIFVDGEFQVPTLLRQRGILFIPEDALLGLNRIGPMTGGLESHAWLRYETGWAFPELREGSFVLQDTVLDQPELRLPVTLSLAEVRVAENGEHRFEVAGTWGVSDFKATGAFGFHADVFPFQSARVFARLDMNEALPVLLGGFEPPLAFDRPVAANFSMVREKDRWKSSGRVDLEGVTLRNKQVSMNPPGPDDHIDFHLFVGPGRHLELEEVLCRFRGSVLEVSGGYDLARKDLLTMELSSPSLDLEDLGLRFRDHGRPTEGVIQGRVKIMASRKDPPATMVLGNLQGAGISAQLHRLPSPIRDTSFSLDFSGKSISVASLRMRVGQSELDVSGDLEGWRRIKGELNVKTEFLDPEEFVWQRTREPSSEPLIPETVNVRLQIQARNARWRNLPIGPMRGEIHLTGGEVRLARSRIRLEYGVLTTSGHMRSTPAPEVYVSNHVRLTGQPIQELLKSLDVKSPFLQGTLNLEAFLTLEGRNFKDLLPSLSGNADVAILKGALRQAGVFSRILEIMSLERLVKGKPGDLPEGAFYFERMEGFAAVDRGVVFTENFMMSSPIYNAVAAGEADLKEKAVAFTLGIQPLETLDTFVSRIPIIGYALTGRNRSFLTYYFEVKGPMSDPTTRHVPFKHLGGGVAGALKRLFLTPFRLYGNFSGDTKPPSERP